MSFMPPASVLVRISRGTNNPLDNGSPDCAPAVYSRNLSPCYKTLPPRHYPRYSHSDKAPDLIDAYIKERRSRCGYTQARRSSSSPKPIRMASLPDLKKHSSSIFATTLHRTKLTSGAIRSRRTATFPPAFGAEHFG